MSWLDWIGVIISLLIVDCTVSNILKAWVYARALKAKKDDDKKEAKP